MKKVIVGVAAAVALVAAGCASTASAPEASDEKREAGANATATVTFTGGTIKFPKGDPQAMDALPAMTATNTGGTAWSVPDFGWPCVSEQVMGFGTVYILSQATGVSMNWDSGSPDQTSFSNSVTVTIQTNKPEGQECTPVADKALGTGLTKKSLRGVTGASNATIKLSGLKVNYVSSAGSSYSLANNAVSIPKSSGTFLLSTAINVMYGLPGTGGVTANLTITSP